jgi:hypothetical protein
MDSLVQQGGLAKPREIRRTALRLLPGELGHGNFASVSKGVLQESPLTPSFIVAAKVCIQFYLLRFLAVLALLGLMHLATISVGLRVSTSFHGGSGYNGAIQPSQRITTCGRDHGM